MDGAAACVVVALGTGGADGDVLSVPVVPTPQDWDGDQEAAFGAAADATPSPTAGCAGGAHAAPFGVWGDDSGTAAGDPNGGMTGAGEAARPNPSEPNEPEGLAEAGSGGPVTISSGGQKGSLCCGVAMA